MLTSPNAKVREYFVWRLRDVKRNSKNNLGHCHLSQRDMHGHSARQVEELLKEKG
jgi:tRNA(His) 5'-end guanylyltransferase